MVLQLLTSTAEAQFATKYLSIGNLHGWFANTGCEREEGLRTNQQQNGLQWPAIYLYQDVQAAKGLWIGTSNFTDPNGTPWTNKVVHVGPRVTGDGEFFPVRFDMISKFTPPQVFVDGILTEGKPVVNEFVDPNLACDRMIINTVNTALGLTMTRKVMAWSQQYHDNYFLYDVVLTNTGNTDGDPEIELPSTTLNGVYIYYQFRIAVCRDARYVISNSAGWGINTMNDTRGDGLNPANTFFPGNQDNDVRAQYAWMGRFPGVSQPIANYDNIGAPVLVPPTGSGIVFSDPSDTSGRLTAPQFMGMATLHADISPGNPADDPTQPRTTSYEGSDDPLNFNNSQFAVQKMIDEYGWMSLGHADPRHADKVGTGDPSQGRQTSSTSGGQSFANGFGPYMLAHGDSIRIVWVEAVAGLSREKAISVGERYKNGLKYGLPFPTGISAQQKNDSVYTGRDSLFQTFRRAIANYASGLSIPQPPFPPREVNVVSGGDRVSINWDPTPGGPTVQGWRVYRATGQYWKPYVQVHTGDLPASTLSFDDTQVTRAVANYYYVVAVGDPAENTGGGMTPPGIALVSSRYYSQTYDAAFLKRPAGVTLEGIRVVPNPYIISANKDLLRFPGEEDKITFLDIPGKCTIRIYTELGEKIQEIVHTDGSGDASWNSNTSSSQIVVSGVYIVHFTVDEDQLDASGNVVYRKGETAFRKFVVIR